LVSADGVGLLREMAEGTGLVDGILEALIGTYRGVPVHATGRVFTDLAAAVADGVDAISGIAVLGDREELHGPVASMPADGLANTVIVERRGVTAVTVRAWRAAFESEGLANCGKVKPGRGRAARRGDAAAASPDHAARGRAGHRLAHRSARTRGCGVLPGTDEGGGALVE
jgi:hypothetical protein